MPGTLEEASTEEPFEPLARAALTLARRVAAGGTLFSAAPAWPWHAQHVAVEFVHPVVVGARAVDAVAVPAEDPVGWLRPLARRGDVVVLVADGADRTARRLAARAALWGVTSIWLAVGEPPPVGAAHHVVHLYPDPAASFSGRAVLGYHLLWELSQLCFEHPGLLAPGPSTDTAETACVGDHCVTCSDEGRLGEVLAVAGTTARCATERGEEPVDTGLLGPLAPGDLVLIHAGVALQVLPEEALLREESVLAGELPR